MSLVYFISGISWFFAGLYGGWVLYHLFQPNGPTDAAGQGMETAVKGLFCFLFVAQVGLNLLPFPWTKTVALLFGIMLVLLVAYIKNH